MAYLGLDPRSGFLVNLVLENVGQGPACDVEFFVDADPKDFADHEVMYVTAGTTRKVRSLLPQAERVERLMGVGNRLFSEDEEARLQPFRVEVSYSNLRGVPIGPREYVLDIAELGGAVQSTPTERRLADSLEKIERHLGHFSTTSKSPTRSPEADGALAEHVRRHWRYGRRHPATAVPPRRRKPPHPRRGRVGAASRGAEYDVPHLRRRAGRSGLPGHEGVRARCAT